MPWRLIQFIVILAIVLLFVAFNYTNRCDINFWFSKGIKDAPVFLALFVSFFLGVLCTLPFVFGGRKKFKKEKTNKPLDSKKPEKNSGTSSEDSEYSDKNSYGIN